MGIERERGERNDVCVSAWSNEQMGRHLLIMGCKGKMMEGWTVRGRVMGYG